MIKEGREYDIACVAGGRSVDDNRLHRRGVQKEELLYTGAPIVSVKQTDFNSDTGYLKYRLEV